jgi:hypothetical protein
MQENMTIFYLKANEFPLKCRYDLSKVNLSEAVSNRLGQPTNLAKPAIRLSFDPLSENVKRHVAGRRKSGFQ